MLHNKIEKNPRNCREDDIYMLGRAMYMLISNSNEKHNKDAMSLVDSLIHKDYNERVKSLEKIKQSAYYKDIYLGDELNLILAKQSKKLGRYDLMIKHMINILEHRNLNNIEIKDNEFK